MMHYLLLFCTAGINGTGALHCLMCHSSCCLLERFRRLHQEQHVTTGRQLDTSLSLLDRTFGRHAVLLLSVHFLVEP